MTLAAALMLAGCSSGSGSSPTSSAVTVSVSAAASRVLTSHQVQLTATVTGATNTAVAWSATAGSVDADGLFTAPDAPGSVTITATSAACPSCSGTATIEVDRLLVSVTSPQADMLSSHQLQLAAAVTGWTDTAVTWSATAGSVDAAGLFTAPDAAGPVTVMATSTACSTCSGSATIEVHRVVVSVAPEQTAVLSGEKVQLAATVTGWSDTSFTWSVTAGSIDDAGMFTAPADLGPVQVTATSVADPARSATATVSVFEIPVVSVVTDDGEDYHGCPVGFPTCAEDDKDVKRPGSVAIDPRDGSAAFGPVRMVIKGRGNSTWLFPKKPYKVKLDAKAGLLGMPADKEWALLANYADKTLIRNAVAMELGNRLGLPWSPRSRAVELDYNGRYDGTYQLIETVKIATDRVNIPKLAATDTSGDALTGGYLVEVDNTHDGLVVWDGGRFAPMVLKEPDPPTTEQQTYIADYLHAAEDALFSADFADPTVGYPAYWNVDTLVDWYLVEEILKNVDGDFYSSCFLYKDRLDPLLHMGPLWDFDLAAGNAGWGHDHGVIPVLSAGTTDGWYVRNGPYLAQLYQDPAFAQRVRDRWNAVKADQLDTISTYIDETAATLAHAQAANFVRWPVLGPCVVESPTCVPPVGPLTTYQAEVDYLKTWLQGRIAWMDAAFQAEQAAVTP